MKKKRTGDLLVERGTISADDLNRALATQQEKNLRLGEVLVQNVHIAKKDIAAGVEQVLGAKFVECPPKHVAPEALALISRSVAIRACALPLELRGNTLIIAMAEPQDLRLLDELQFNSGKSISSRFSFRQDIFAGIRKFYGNESASGPLVIEDAQRANPAPDDQETSEAKARQDQREEQEDEDDTTLGDVEFFTASTREENREAMKELQAGTKQRTMAVRFVTMIMARAAKRGASDIHVEPRVGGAVVRLRIDGILRELLTVPGDHQAAVISRIKILADMDITERRLPQDGRFLLQHRGRRLDVRVSSLPTHFGEKIVMRVLDPRSALITFEQLGLSQAHATAIRRILEMPQGTLLVTGPTGSGKSTTLYGALNFLHSPERNIITVEDPVEYMLDGVNQVQVHARIGLTFAGCLRSILRQDPDVIMVGEIRDGETAEIALRASQTGHFVLSTLHTNDSLGAIDRLIDLGIPPYLITSVTGVIGQRLLRRLCSCRKVVPATPAYQHTIKAWGLDAQTQMYAPAGCPACENTGYKGRIGIYEVLVIEGAVKDAIQSQAKPEEIKALTRSLGLRTMQDDALEKVRQGLTTIDEVARVVPKANGDHEVRCSACAREFVPHFNHCPFCGAARPRPGEGKESRSIGQLAMKQ